MFLGIVFNDDCWQWRDIWNRDDHMSSVRNHVVVCQKVAFGEMQNPEPNLSAFADELAPKMASNIAQRCRCLIISYLANLRLGAFIGRFKVGKSRWFSSFDCL
jgi:hypothetical protein